jgi:hypothetical protein
LFFHPPSVSRPFSHRVMDDFAYERKNERDTNIHGTSIDTTFTAGLLHSLRATTLHSYWRCASFAFYFIFSRCYVWLWIPFSSHLDAALAMMETFLLFLYIASLLHTTT